MISRCRMKVNKEKWGEWRDKLFPIIQQTELRNQHQFSQQIDEALSTERASLFCSEDGFFVLKPELKDKDMEVVVLFAFCWASNGIETYQSVIESLSQDIGAVRLRVYTVIEKLEPVLIGQGYVKEHGSSRVRCWMKTL